MHRLTTLLCATLFLTFAATAQEEPTTELVSIMPDGGQANEVPQKPPAISADGRYVVFEIEVAHLLYRHDRTTGTTEPASVDSNGDWIIVSRTAASSESYITADGRYVFFKSDHLNESELPPEVPVEGAHYFMRDMEAGVTEWIEIPTTDGLLPNKGLQYDAISADGRYVAFSSHASNLLPGGAFFEYEGETLKARDIYVYDRENDRLERVSVASDGSPGDHDTPGEAPYSMHSAISADGRYVAFTSFATNLVPDDTNDAEDIFVHDRETGTTERVSVASDGTEANAASGIGNGTIAISADGRYVAFMSFSTNLVPGEIHELMNIFVHDRETGTTEQVDVASDGSPANHYSNFVAINADGRYVAFMSGSTNLVSDDTNGQQDVFVHDRETGSTERVSVASDGSEGNWWSNKPGGFSADGRFVAFMSDASNLVSNDFNGDPDVFVRDRGAQTVATEDGPLAFHLSNATPNPAAASTTPTAWLTLRVPEAQHVTARVYDALGRQVATVHDGSLAAGVEARLDIDTTNLTAGVYVVRVEGETFAETRRVTVVR